MNDDTLSFLRRSYRKPLSPKPGNGKTRYLKRPSRKQPTSTPIPKPKQDYAQWFNKLNNNITQYDEDLPGLLSELRRSNIDLLVDPLNYYPSRLNNKFEFKANKMNAKDLRLDLDQLNSVLDALLSKQLLDIHNVFPQAKTLELVKSKFQQARRELLSIKDFKVEAFHDYKKRLEESCFKKIQIIEKKAPKNQGFLFLLKILL